MSDLMPSSITICGVPYTVEQLDEVTDEDGSYEALITYRTATIRMANHSTPYFERCTLWHEIFHALCKHTGHLDAKQDEGLMEALSYGVVALLRNNPELIKYTIEDDTKE